MLRHCYYHVQHEDNDRQIYTMSIVVSLNSVNEFYKLECQILTAASLNLNETFVKR